MGRAQVNVIKHIDVAQHFKFKFKVGSFGKQERFKPVNKKSRYADGPSRAKSTKLDNITNNEVVGFLLDKKINVLATPFESKDTRLGKAGWYFYNIANDYERELYIKKTSKLLADVVKEFMRKGEFGKNSKGFRRTIDTGQLHSSIKAIFNKIT